MLNGADSLCTLKYVFQKGNASFQIQEFFSLDEEIGIASQSEAGDTSRY